MQAGVSLKLEPMKRLPFLDPHLTRYQVENIALACVALGALAALVTTFVWSRAL